MKKACTSQIFIHGLDMILLKNRLTCVILYYIVFSLDILTCITVKLSYGKREGKVS